MQTKLFLCANSSALDSRRNTISIFHVLEEVHAPAYPVVLAGMSVVALLELDEGEPLNPEIELRVFLGKEQLFAGPFQANFQVRRKARALAEFNGLVVPARAFFEYCSIQQDTISSAGKSLASKPPLLNLNCTCNQPNSHPRSRVTS